MFCYGDVCVGEIGVSPVQLAPGRGEGEVGGKKGGNVNYSSPTDTLVCMFERRVRFYTSVPEFVNVSFFSFSRRSVP